MVEQQTNISVHHAHTGSTPQATHTHSIHTVTKTHTHHTHRVRVTALSRRRSRQRKSDPSYGQPNNISAQYAHTQEAHTHTQQAHTQTQEAHTHATHHTHMVSVSPICVQTA